MHPEVPTSFSLAIGPPGPNYSILYCCYEALWEGRQSSALRACYLPSLNRYPFIHLGREEQVRECPVSNKGFLPVRFSMVTVLSIVWPQSLLLCPFHKKLRIWEESFGFCQTIICDLVSWCIAIHIDNLLVEIWKWIQFEIRKSTNKKSLVILTWDFP